MAVTMDMVRELREATGVGIMDCKAALKETNGDMAAAKKLLREQGLEIISEGRATTEGRVTSYLHHSGRIGVLLEVDCNTDFTANNDDFRKFMSDVSLHIASEKPSYIQPEDVPEDVLKQEKEVFKKQAEAEGKPAEIAEKIVDGRIRKFFDEVCLLNQPFVRDPDLTIADMRNDLAAKTGENILIKRFVRYEVGRG